jgi:HPt (histidine-containing phosphotransfer) domain-containing protein
MKETYLACGMNDYISKPIEISELNRTLLKWLPKEHIVITEVKKQETGASGTMVGRLSEGLDTKQALLNIGGSEEAYILVIKAFMTSIPEKLSRMTDYIGNNDWSAFRIDIHSCKSSLANIGAMEISDEARALEMAAISQNYVFVKNNFRGLVSHLEDLFAFIGDIVSENVFDESHAKIRGSVEVLRNLLEDVRVMIDNLEHDVAMELMDRITSESYGLDLDRRLFQMRAAIDSFNYDRASDMIFSILDIEDK